MKLLRLPKLATLKRTLNERGAIIIFTALALPLLIAGTGLAVDLGNLYIQHARLQHAADAAALAGANAYAENDESTSTHPLADAEAYRYILGEYHDLAEDEDIAAPDYQARIADDSTTLYRVKLAKDVPLYFLRVFTGPTYQVEAASIASIVSINNINTPTNLFMFEKEFDAVNSLTSPDKMSNDKYSTDSTNMITTVFDGRIAYTDRYGKATKDSYSIKNGDAKVTYSTQTSTLDRFFTSKAKTDNQTKNMSDIMASGNDATFAKSGGLEDGYYHYAEFEAYDYAPFMNYVKSITSAATAYNSQSLKTSDDTFASNYIRVERSNSVTNLDITVDKTLDNPNNADEPVYVYVNTVDESGAAMSVVNINLYADTGRPLILCFDGDSDNRSTQIHFNLNGHTFKGMIYSPYANESEGVLVNAENSTFYGSIYAGNKLSLRGNNSTFIFRDYVKNGGGSTSGKTSSTSHKIRLVNDSSISWD